MYILDYRTYSHNLIRTAATDNLTLKRQANTTHNTDSALILRTYKNDSDAENAKFWLA